MDKSKVKDNGQINKNFEKFLKSQHRTLEMSKETYVEYRNYYDSLNFRYKIINVLISFIFLFIFTYIYYNFIFSIFFAVITFLLFLCIGKLYAIIFILIYIIILISIINERRSYLGNPILKTDIIKNHKAYDTTSGGLTILSDKLPKDLNSGFYTYSFWIYINGYNHKNSWNSYRFNEWKNVFYRGNDISNVNDLSNLIQFPGVWLTPVFNNMVIVFQNGNIVERVELDNLEFNIWTNFTLVLESKSISIYINGLLDRTLNLNQNINIINNYNLYITNDISFSKSNKSGYPGFLSQLICFNYALRPSYIYNSYKYYKEILNKYQNKIDYKEKYNIPSLITNSDYL